MRDWPGDVIRPTLLEKTNLKQEELIEMSVCWWEVAKEMGMAAASSRHAAIPVSKPERI